METNTMSIYTRSQNLETGTPGKLRVRGKFGKWWVESCDRNGVWVAADPSGREYASEAEAVEAMEAFNQ